MTKRMLIDATHAEETRVVVLDGSRLEDFDVETSSKRQLKGNIYLAKVIRVEPSLQAAFVEYGGNRHGFLAFAEIHPDYYQIPVADRQRLIAAELEQARLEEEQADLEMALEQAARGRHEPEARIPDVQTIEHNDDDAAGPEADPVSTESAAADWMPEADPEPQGTESAQPLAIEAAVLRGQDEPATAVEVAQADAPAADMTAAEPALAIAPAEAPAEPAAPVLAAEAPTPDEAPDAAPDAEQQDAEQADEPPAYSEQVPDPFDAPAPFTDSAEEPYVASADDEPYTGDDIDTDEPDAPPPETVGGDQDAVEERQERRSQPRFLRNYKIQEVIHRRQILLIQVVKEERGTKGAALTTYLSLAGRFSVLMPNSPRGGGISRKITSAADRRRLKEVMTELDIPKGMGLIVRTAGAQRPKPEIRRDCEYLLRLWDDIRDLTMKSVAPALIYEEASLIKRAIRDVYSRDIDEILVDGEEGWRAAHDFMRMLMPTHAKKVQLWRDPQPLFARGQVEAQLDAMLQPIVQLRSGGYLVINQTEALVAIDVNSGRSTRERNIEETALRTNLEAADEAARQLRLRDLAGLIVIDFIDMESKRHNAMVERRIKDALKNDRARIQVGSISHFGLLEMSRQRLRPSLAEASFIACPHCSGTGHVRSTENAAIHVLRAIEEEGGKRRAAEIVVHLATAIALYLLNHKRDRLQEIERRAGMRVIIAADDSQIGTEYRIERTRARSEGEIVPPPVPAGLPPLSALAMQDPDLEDDEIADEAEDETPAPRAAATAAAPARAETAEEAAERGRRRRRRRRRGGRREDGSTIQAGDADADQGDEAEGDADATDATDGPVAPAGDTPDALSEPAESVEPAVAEPVAVEAAADSSETDEEAKGRRRGRRGGRRKRRDENEAELPALAEPGAAQPDLPPVYAGPTPADPFGGQAFDIFDVLEQAEQRAAAAVLASEAAPAPVAIEQVAVEQVAVEPVAAEPVAAEPVLVAPAEAEAESAPESAPAAVEDLVAQTEPVAEADPVPPVESIAPVEPEPEVAVAAIAAAPVAEAAVAEVVSTEPVVGPAIQPIVIDEAPPVEQKKRGWWRR